MRLLILGADGQLGSEFVRLLSPSMDITGLSSDVDITNRDVLQQAMERAHPDVVVNCAAYTSVDKAEAAADLAYRVNVIGAQNVAQAARRIAARVVCFSTDYIFDGTASQPYVEDDVPAPLSVYGKTKLLGEQATREANPDHLICRLAWLYGPVGHNFVRTILRLAREKDVLRVVADQTGSPTFTEDVVHQVLALLSDGASGTYHCVDTGAVTWYDFACAVLRHYGLATPIVPIRSSDYPSAARRPSFSVLADYKLDLESLNIMRPWQEALGDCIARYREVLLHA